jgi:hypothetical protein
MMPETARESTLFLEVSKYETRRGAAADPGCGNGDKLSKLQGAIAGRALYDGRLDADEALRLIRAARAG